jgi:hypothetical protein
MCDFKWEDKLTPIFKINIIVTLYFGHIGLSS